MSYDLIKNFKQGQLSDTRENINLIVSKMEAQGGGVNEEFLSKNDYIKFHQIEVAGTDGEHSTIIKDKDGSGEVEIIDTLDDNDKEEVLDPYFVFLDESGEIVPLHPNFHRTDSSDWMSHVPMRAEDQGEVILSFIQEASRGGKIDFVANSDSRYSKDILRMKSIVKYEERTGKYLVYLDENDMVVPYFDNAVNKLHYSEPWTAELEEVYSAEASSIPTGIEDEAFDYFAQQHPELSEEISRMKTIKKYEVRGASYKVKVDKKMKVIGRNMFNDTIKKLMEQFAELQTSIEKSLPKIEVNYVNEDLYKYQFTEAYIDMWSYNMYFRYEAKEGNDFLITDLNSTPFHFKGVMKMYRWEGDLNDMNESKVIMNEALELPIAYKDSFLEQCSHIQDISFQLYGVPNEPFCVSIENILLKQGLDKSSSLSDENDNTKGFISYNNFKDVVGIIPEMISSPVIFAGKIELVKCKPVLSVNVNGVDILPFTRIRQLRDTLYFRELAIPLSYEIS